jgi:hypothetical protein
MIKKSKVTRVTGNGTWEGKYGLMYKFEIEMENGDIGEYSAKMEKQLKFIEGEEVEYEFIGGDWPKIKPVWNNNFNSNTSKNEYTKEEKVWFEEKDRRITKQCVLKCAVDLVCNDKIDISEVETYANNMLDWVYGDIKTTKKVEQPPF